MTLLTKLSQLLGLLVELNNAPQVPKRLRYDLTPASAPKDIAKTASSLDEEAAHETLRSARDRVQKGEMTTSEYESMQSELLNTTLFAPSKKYSSLMKIARVTPKHIDSSDEGNVSSGVGTLTIRQEEQYLKSLDAFLDGQNTNPRSHVASSLGSRNAERTADREREFQQKNPVSVYNWLRKHQPQVFLQDHEAPGDKSSKPAGSRISKRTTGGKDIKQENELYDTDGIAVEYGASAKGKRKRDDDGAFRPKGGKSGHPAKRRKEEGGGSSKKLKRPSIDTRNS